MYQSALSELENGYLDINADGTAVITVRPHGPEELLALPSPDDELGGVIAWDQVFEASPGASNDGGDGWFIVYEENDNGVVYRVYVANVEAQLPGSSTNNVQFIADAQAGTGNDVFQGLSFTSYYDRNYGDGDIGFFCAGKEIYYVDYGGGGAPTTSTWRARCAGVNDAGFNSPYDYKAVVAFRGHIVFTDGDLIQWSDLNDYRSVPAINIAGADQVNDSIETMIEYNGELVVFGRRSVEFWQLTGAAGASALAPTVSATIDMGIATGSTAFVWKDALYFVNNKYEVIKLYNRQTEVISTPISKDITPTSFQVNIRFALSAITLKGKDFLMVKRLTNLQSTGTETFVLNLESGTWARWTRNVQTGNAANVGMCLAATSGNNGVTIGARETDDQALSRIFTFEDFASATSLDFKIQTGFVDHGTFSNKRSNKLFFRALNGTIDDFTFKYRDTDSDPFQTIATNVSPQPHIGEFIGLGRYRTRQYEITATPTESISISQGEEDIEELDF